MGKKWHLRPISWEKLPSILKVWPWLRKKEKPIIKKYFAILLLEGRPSVNDRRCIFTFGRSQKPKLNVFSSRKQELLKYFSIFFYLLSSFFFQLWSNIANMSYIQVLLIIFLIISDYFFFDFFDFFRFFLNFSKKFFSFLLFLVFNLFSILFLREHWTYI